VSFVRFRAPQQAFADYYTAAYAAAISTSRWQPLSSLRPQPGHGQRVFGNQLVLCRNVLIYFNKNCRTAPLDCFTNRWGIAVFLGLGGKEKLIFQLHPLQATGARRADFSQAAGAGVMDEIIRKLQRIKAVVIGASAGGVMR
jgi:hypothetical protein